MSHVVRDILRSVRWTEHSPTPYRVMQAVDEYAAAAKATTEALGTNEWWPAHRREACAYSVVLGLLYQGTDRVVPIESLAPDVMRERRALPASEEPEEPTEEESPWRGGEHAAYVAESQANIQQYLKR